MLPTGIGSLGASRRVLKKILGLFLVGGAGVGPARWAATTARGRDSPWMLVLIPSGVAVGGRDSP